MNFTIPILSELFGLGREWIKGKQKIKAAKAEAEAKVIVKSAENAADWEKLHAKASADSWKDEYWTIVLSLPFLACFNKEWVDEIQAGFKVLETLPEWYQWSLLLCISASFGVRMTKLFKK